MLESKDAGRQRWSWAKELCAGLINTFPDLINSVDRLQQLGRQIINNPGGGLIRIDNDESAFVWGDVHSLIDYLRPLIESQLRKDEWTEIIKRNLIDTNHIGLPRLVIHIDTAPNVPVEILNEYGFWNLKEATRTLKKADLLLTSPDTEKVIGLSVKSGTGSSEVKLSQQSTSATYDFKPRSFTLEGGLNLGPLLKINRVLQDISDNQLVVENTRLLPSQFNKLNAQHKRYAVLKKKHPTEWEESVKAAMGEATENLRLFSNAISSEGTTAQHNLSVLLKTRLIGDEIANDKYQLWLSGYNSPINLSDMVNNLDRFSNVTKLWGEFKKAQGSGKISLVIYAQNESNKLYVICKIEPAFDGGRPQVSQTKGVIYYFQEGRQLHKPTVWELIEDAWENYQRDVYKDEL